MLHHITDVLKRVNIKMLKIKIYTFLLYVYLNKLQNQITLKSQVNNKIQKT